MVVKSNKRFVSPGIFSSLCDAEQVKVPSSWLECLLFLDTCTEPSCNSIVLCTNLSATRTASSTMPLTF